MPYKIAIASGKGGTGKTTVAVNLLLSIYKHWNEKVQLIDCDVEEPNDLLFFQEFKLQDEKVVNQHVPVIDTEKCTFCRKCEEYCEFNAIILIPLVGFAKVNPDLCHSCGACSHACRSNAIHEGVNRIGNISDYRLNFGADLKEGSLRIGSPMQTLLIKELKKDISGNPDILLFDAPPGTSCSMVESIADSDFVILVTEPTPFGLYDLKLTVDLMKTLKKKFGVIINKAGLGSTEVYEYLLKENIELLGEIPFSKEYATQYAKGKLLTDIPLSIENNYLNVVKLLRQKQAVT